MPTKNKKEYRFMLSTSMFFFPGYSKVYKDFGVKDETDKKQLLFMNVIHDYVKKFDRDQWYKDNVLVRIYLDGSLEAYESPDGTRPWTSVLADISNHENFQLVSYACADPSFRESAHTLERVGKSKAALSWHRGLLGTMMRFHAAFDFPENRIAKCVCLVDIDSVYTDKWWKLQEDFLTDQTARIMALTGPMEIGLHGYVFTDSLALTESENIPLFCKGGLTSVRSLLDPVAWNEFPERWRTMRRDLRSIDMLRFIFEEPPVRLMEDFAYGFDERVLNEIFLKGREIKRIGTFRVNAAANFASMLLRTFKWNGKSVAMRELAVASGFEDIDAMIAFVESFVPVAAPGADRRPPSPSMDELESVILSRFRPHVKIMFELQIDRRMLHAIQLPRGGIDDSFVNTWDFLKSV